MLAAQTVVTVLGVPVPGRRINGLDSLLSIVQRPAALPPVATFAIGNAGAINAALCARRDPLELASPISQTTEAVPRGAGRRGAG